MANFRFCTQVADFRYKCPFDTLLGDFRYYFGLVTTTSGVRHFKMLLRLFMQCLMSVTNVLLWRSVSDFVLFQHWFSHVVS